MPAADRPSNNGSQGDTQFGGILLNRLEPDYAAAAHYLRPPADAGDEESGILLADLLFSGKGGEKDRAAAFRYMQPAVERKNPRAMARAGFMLATGDGVPQDAGRGLYLLNAAGKLGHTGALVGLGALYYYDRFGMQNRDLAIEYLRRAAASGDARAVDMLGSEVEVRRDWENLVWRERDQREEIEKLKATIQRLERQLETVQRSVQHQQQVRLDTRDKEAAREKAKLEADRELARQHRSLDNLRAEIRYTETMDRIHGNEFDARARARVANERNTRNETRLDKLVDSVANDHGRVRYYHGYGY